MNRRSRLSKGQMAVVMTLALPVLLGAIGLAADVGILYFNWVTLQKAADSAALAGAVYLIPSGNLPAPLSGSPTVAAGCGGWGSNAKDVACSYATYNSVPSSQVNQINVPAPNPPPSAGSAQTIQVVLKRDNIPTYFLRLVGRTTPFTVATAATAVAPSPATSSKNLFPAGMPGNPGGQTGCLTSDSCFGTTFSLTSTYSPGNWGWLNIPDGFVGSTDPSSATSGSGATQLDTNIQNGCNCQLSTGDWVMPKTGENWGPTKTAVDTRTGGTTQTITDANLSLSDFVNGGVTSPRLVTVPIVDWSTSNGGSSAVQILGFAQVWIVGISKSGSDQILQVQFVRGLDPNVVAGGGSSSYGSYMRPTLIE